MNSAKRTTGAAGLVAIIGAIGVVFGDIGTSTLYTFSVTMGHLDPGADRTFAPAQLLGLTSTLFWTLTLIVGVLYVRFLLRADNNGEGGLLSLLALVRRTTTSRRLTALITVLGMLGAAMFLGDSVITPAISVHSAVESLRVAVPGLAHFVVPIAVGIVVALFALQRRGTHSIGKIFGPVTLLWFVVLTALGAVSIVQSPAVLTALSPHWAILLIVDDPLAAFLALGSVVLAVTGAEALYSDMGHFGRMAIARAWLWIVYPALVVNYLGQAALVMRDPTAAGHPFFGLAPSALQLPLVVLATAATIIASQAVITGASAVVLQAMRLTLLPPLAVRRPDPEHPEHSYVPTVNRMLGVCVVAVIIVFGSSEKLASAYGIAVSVTILVTTTMYLILLFERRPRPAGAIVVVSVIAVVVVSLLASTLTKVAGGGWLPLSLAAAVLAVMWSWHAGADALHRARGRLDRPLKEAIVAAGKKAPRVPGSAVFFVSHPNLAPLALTTMLEHGRGVEERLAIITWRTLDVPVAPAEERVAVSTVGDPGDGIVHALLRFGFNEPPLVRPALVEIVRQAGEELKGFSAENALFFASRSLPTIPRRKRPSLLRKACLRLTRVVPEPSLPIDVPADRAVAIGRRIEL